MIDSGLNVNQFFRYQIGFSEFHLKDGSVIRNG